MSGNANGPLLTPRQAGMLLDDVIFTRVVSLIDLPELYDLEALLTLQIESFGMEHEQARRTAKDLIDRALVRVARTPRRWTIRGSPDDDDEACDLCRAPIGPFDPCESFDPCGACDAFEPAMQPRARSKDATAARSKQRSLARPKPERSARTKPEPAERAAPEPAAAAARPKSSRTGA